MYGPIYVRRYLLNLARLAVTTGLAVGLFGTAALLLAGRFLAAYGDLLFLAAVLLPVLVCLLGFEKKPLRAVGLTARRCDPGDFFFGMLWAAIGFLGILWVAFLLTERNDVWIGLFQSASVPRLAHYLIVGFCEELLFRGGLSVASQLVCRRERFPGAPVCVFVWAPGELSDILHGKHLDGCRVSRDVEPVGCNLFLLPRDPRNCRAAVPPVVLSAVPRPVSPAGAACPSQLIQPLVFFHRKGYTGSGTWGTAPIAKNRACTFPTRRGDDTHRTDHCCGGRMGESL